MYLYITCRAERSHITEPAVHHFNTISMDHGHIRVAIHREAWRTVGGAVQQSERIGAPGELLAPLARLSDTRLPED